MNRNHPVIVDVFNHLYPDEYVSALPKEDLTVVENFSRLSKGFRDMDYRIGIMDKQGISRQVLSLGNPGIDDTHTPVKDLNTKLARAANDGVARIVQKYPGRFSGIGTVSLTNPSEATEEFERCVKDLGLVGVQVLSNAAGKPLDLPEFDEFYAKACKLDAPVWMHHGFMRKTYDWVNEYNLGVIMGWGMDTSMAMFRIVRGGVYERHPGLKIITHHMGMLIPFYAFRIDRAIMQQGKEGNPPPPLSKRPMEYMKMFYVDTAEGMWLPALTCSHMFFGHSHLLFASDYPYTGEFAPQSIINTVNQLNASDEEKSMMLGGNASKLLKINDL